MMKKMSRWICAFVLMLTISQISSGENLVDEESGDAPEEVMPTMPEVPPAIAAPLSCKWVPTDFSNQIHALGWTPEAFSVPAGMEERVQFWKDIYTKYTSDQGLLHDSKYINLVYDSLDFSDITARADLTDKQKEKARRDRKSVV